MKNPSATLMTRLEESPVRKRLLDHEFVRRVERGAVSKEQAAVVIGQWWHPLHYFPTFLARCIAALPNIESKSAISRILAQETGAGDAARAHEVIYIRTMEGAGFVRRQIVDERPFAETAALVNGYEQGSDNAFAALGCIFATEVTDLMMVSAVGKTVTAATGVRDLAWVDIHVNQEPDHVEQANHAMLKNFSAAEQSLVLRNAEQMWRLWIGFFDRLLQEISDTVTRPAEPVPA